MKNGFTLIEVVVAMVIAGILLSVIYYSYSLSVRITTSGNDILDATTAAKSVYHNFIEKKMSSNEPLEESEESGQLGEEWNYKIDIKKPIFNVNNSFDITPENAYKILIMLFKESKEYKFEFYIQK